MLSEPVKNPHRILQFILDFFAGSGTTAQAVLELNQQDGGRRKFILCTNNKNNICTDVTYPRIQTVITGKRQDGSQYSDGIPANLKYYHTDFVAKDEEYLSEELLKHIGEMIQLEDDLLNFCFVYTFDEKYKADLLSDMDKAYEVRRLFLKDKCKTFTLEKQVRDLDFDGLGEREVFHKVYEYLVKKYHLGTNKKDNQTILTGNGYSLGTEIFGQALQGQFVRTDMVLDSSSYFTTRKRVDTHKHGMQLLHSVDSIKKQSDCQLEKSRQFWNAYSGKSRSLIKKYYL